MNDDTTRYADRRWHRETDMELIRGQGSMTGDEFGEWCDTLDEIRRLPEGLS